MGLEMGDSSGGHITLVRGGVHSTTKTNNEHFCKHGD